MAHELSCNSLRDANVKLIDCDHRTPPASDTGYPYVAIPQLRDGRIQLSEARRIKPEDYVEWTKKAKPEAHDVVLSRRCNPGESAVVEPGMEFALGQNLVLLRADGTKVYPPYLRWLVRSPEWWEQVWKFINVGAVFDSLKCADIPNFELPLPSLPEQQEIAHILGTLDDKIELNRRMNETLEAMARAIFKSWFVDFDPVRAKAEGRKPFGMDAPTAALFPSSFQDSPLGNIPRGWCVAELGDICEIIDCLHSKKPERRDTGKQLLQLWNIRDNGLLDLSDTFWVSEEDYARWTSRIEASPGDCAITNVGRVGAVSQIPLGVKAALGRNMTGIRPKPSHQYPTFLIECLLSSAMRSEIELRIDSGTILDSLNVRNIPRLRLVLSPTTLLERFEVLCRPLRHRMETNQEESRTLAAIRDALLPKLISGEIRVKDAEKCLAKL